MSDTNTAPEKPDDHGIQPGAIVMVAEEAVSTQKVVRIAIRSFVEGKTLGLPFPKLPVTAFIGGHARRQRAMNSEIALLATSPTIVRPEHQLENDWTRPESLQQVLAAMHESAEAGARAIVAYQDLPCARELAQFKEGLLRLDAAAKSASSFFVLIVRVKDLHVLDPLHLEQDVALISACEPDPDYVEAFDVQWQHTDGLLKQRLGHWLAQFDSGKKSIATAFTGETYEIRRIHAGVAAGLSQAQVGADLNAKAPRVCTLLAKVKRYPPRNNPKEWYEAQLNRPTPEEKNTPAE